MAKSNATLKCSWVTGIIYAVVIAVVAAVVIYVGLYYAMPYEMVVFNAYDQAISVQFTADFYSRSMQLMMVSVIFPVIAYLFTYFRYTQLVGVHPEEKEQVKKGTYGRPWILALILQMVFTLVWGLVSVGMISMGLGLRLDLFADMILIRQFCLVYGIAMVVDVALLLIGKQFFKPVEVQRA